MIEPTTVDSTFQIPEGIIRARAALRRDLPALLASRWTRGKLACYSADGRIAISKDYLALIGEVNRRGLGSGQFIIERIEPGAGREEDDEIEIMSDV